MSSKTITFRFSDEVISVIEAQARATGSSRTAVVLNALKQSYGVSAPTEPSSIERVQQQLHELEKRLTDLSNQLARIQNREEFDEHSLNAPSSKMTIASTSSIERVQTEDLVQTKDETDSALCEEITSQLQTAESLTPEEHRSLTTQLNYQARILDQVLSASPDMIFVLDRRRRFTYINPVGGRVLKVERHYILGKVFHEIEPFILGKEFGSKCERVFIDGRTVCAEVDISATHEVRTYEYTLNPIVGVDGEIDSVICIAKDITKRKQVELAIWEAEKKYRNVFEFGNDSIFISDLVMQRILNANQKASRRLGYTRRELLQLTVDDVMIPLPESRREEILQELKTKGNTTFEHLQRHKSGKLIPVEFSCCVVEYEGKLAIQSFVRDVTEHKKIEERLRLMETTLTKVADAIVMGMFQGISEESEIRYSFEDET